MIEIKNISKEVIEIIEMVDPSAPGCRIVPRSPPPSKLRPGQSLVRMGYEPGVWIRYCPVTNPDKPRSLL